MYAKLTKNSINYYFTITHEFVPVVYNRVLSYVVAILVNIATTCGNTSRYATTYDNTR